MTCSDGIRPVATTPSGAASSPWSGGRVKARIRRPSVASAPMSPPGLELHTTSPSAVASELPITPGITTTRSFFIPADATELCERGGGGADPVGVDVHRRGEVVALAEVAAD